MVHEQQIPTREIRLRNMLSSPYLERTILKTIRSCEMSLEKLLSQRVVELTLQSPKRLLKVPKQRILQKFPGKPLDCSLFHL